MGDGWPRDMEPNTQVMQKDKNYTQNWESTLNYQYVVNLSEANELNDFWKHDVNELLTQYFADEILNQIQ